MGRIRKTSKELCLKCKHHSGGMGKCLICNYYINTGKRRGCKIGECDKFEKGREKKDDIWEEQFTEVLTRSKQKT